MMNLRLERGGLCGLLLVLLSLGTACGDGDDRGAEGDGGREGREQVPGAFANADATVPSLADLDDAGSDGTTTAKPLALIRVEPSNATLDVVFGNTESLTYKVIGTFEDGSEEDVTSRSVFWVTDGWLVGGFANNAALFETVSSDPRGGLVTVNAAAANPDGSNQSATTTLQVNISAQLGDPRDDMSGSFDIPADPELLFGGTVDAARNATIVYPNDGTVLPPNLRRLDIQWLPGDGANTLYEVAMQGPSVDLVYYMRCGTAVDGGCMFQLDQDGYGLLAESSRDGQPVTISVRATDDAGALVGEKASIQVRFSADNVEGGIYYWTTSNPLRIVRFDFGGTASMPEDFLVPGMATGGDNLDSTCVGCHAISPDGTKVVASHGGQNDGWLTYINDLTRPTTDPDFLTLNADMSQPIQFASFSPDSSKFVAIYGDNEDATDRNLYFHDGTTGNRIGAETVQLAFEPDHPNWSPSGDMIAVSRVGIHNTAQKPYNCGVELLRADGAGWAAPETIVPIVSGLSRYNPNFLPGSELLVYNESTCPGGNNTSGECDADADPTAVTWAIKPEVGATPVKLARAAAPGVQDGGNTSLSDTFPRSSPFESSLGGTKVYWVTVSSKRREGLMNGGGVPHQQLWMFAVDPAKVLAGEDGSFPAFYLPFQDLETSNHIAQWTQRIVSDDPPPPPPAPPPPPGVPEPPPVVIE